jgi:hypothetical protein
MFFNIFIKILSSSFTALMIIPIGYVFIISLYWYNIIFGIVVTCLIIFLKNLLTTRFLDFIYLYFIPKVFFDGRNSLMKYFITYELFCTSMMIETFYLKDFYEKI